MMPIIPKKGRRKPTIWYMIEHIEATRIHTVYYAEVPLKKVTFKFAILFLDDLTFLCLSHAFFIVNRLILQNTLWYKILVGFSRNS